jgi:hypothetical protein
MKSTIAFPSDQLTYHHTPEQLVSDGRTYLPEKKRKNIFLSTNNVRDQLLFLLQSLNSVSKVALVMN